MYLTTFGTYMLLMIQRGMRGGTCHAICRYEKDNNKYMRNYDKNKETSYIKYWDVDNLHVLAEDVWTSVWMSQKLPLGGFKRVESKLQFSQDLIEHLVSNCTPLCQIMPYPRCDSEMEIIEKY